MVKLTSDLIRTLERGDRAKLDNVLDDDHCIRLYFSPSQKRIKVRGQLMTRVPLSAVKEIGSVRCVARNIDVLPTAVSAVINKLTAQLDRLNRPTTARQTSASEFAKSVLSLPDIYNPANYAPFAPSHRLWAESTTANAVKYYAHTLGAFYSTYGIDAGDADFLEFFDHEVDKIYNSKYERPCKDGNVIRSRRDEIYNGLMTRMAQAKVVQSYLLATYPAMGLPTHPIPLMPRVRTIKYEEIKALPYEIYTKYIALLLRLCASGNAYAYAASLNGICGLRMAESCAPYIHELECLGAHGRYFVDTQIDAHLQRTHRLKSQYSHRYVYYGSMMVDLINLRRSQLAALGFAPSEIDDLPFASTAAAPTAHLYPARVSSFARALLELAGCTKQWIEQAAEQMFVAAKIAGTEEDLDVCAHLLRRALATFWGNSGVPYHVLNALLGHEDPITDLTDYASLEAASKYAGMLERCLYLGSLCRTNNPAYSTVPLTAGTTYCLDGNSCYRFSAQDDMYIDCKISALEPNDDIYLALPSGSATRKLQAKCTVDNLSAIQSRPTLPILPSAEMVEQWIIEANRIDLSEIIARYH